MGIGTIASIGGMALGGIGSLMGANSQQKAGEQARADALANQQWVRQFGSSLMQGNQSPYEFGLQNALRLYSGQNPTSQFQAYNPAMVNNNQIDLSQAFGQNYNTGQDALSQWLRSNPDQQRNGALTQNMEQLVSGSPQFDNSEMFKALTAQDADAQTRALGNVMGSAGSLGARFGSANMQKQLDTARQMQNDASVRNLGIASQSFENAQQRRLGAGQILAGLEGQRNNDFLQGIGLLNQGAGLQLQGLGMNQQAAMQAGLANQAAQNSASQFNASNNLANQQFNIQNQQARFAQILQALGLGSQMQLGRQSYNAGLFGTMAGIPTPGANPYAGSLGNTIGDIGQTAALFPYMMQLMNQRGGTNGAK